MLTRENQALVDAARAARAQAYAPYSRFAVGAALLAKSGKIYIGANMESAAFPAGLCAERAALAAAVTAGERAFEAIAVCAGEKPAWPCGVCRQMLREFGGMLVIAADKDGGQAESAMLSELLPRAFTDIS